MSLSVTSQKKRPAPRKNPEGLIDEGMVKDVLPAVGVGFAHAHLEANLVKFDWWAKMSTGKRLLLLVVGGVYFRRQGKHALAYALFAVAGTYVQKYLAEKQAPAAFVPPGAVPAGQQTLVSPEQKQAMLTQEMNNIAGLGAVATYPDFTDTGPHFDPSSLMGPGEQEYEFAVG